MGKQYIVSVDQSTQGTKALLFNHKGILLGRSDRPHEQQINEKGWVSHNPEEIYRNTLCVLKQVIIDSGIDKNKIKGIGISNQRETSLAWNKQTGESVAPAIVWQCARAAAICKRVELGGFAEIIRQKTGMQLSPYFPASKIAWILEEMEGVKKLSKNGNLCHGTIDSWLVYKLTGGASYKTDYSNASRTQLFNLTTLKWDEEVCRIFGINIKNMAEVCDSDACFGETDLEGFLENPIPIHSVLGDSHGALFGQGCLEKGMVKTTYGTGSSIMMNVGEKPVFSNHGVVTSLAWGMGGKVNYVLEGNINYTGAVISWLEKDLQLVTNAKETEELAKEANPLDETYLVPAFTGLGAPYWDSDAKALITGITRITGRAELAKATLESIAYQIMDIIEVMSEDSKIPIEELRVDGGPTKNKYLMQFQSNMIKIPVQVPDAEELSGIGAAYAAGIALKVFGEDVFKSIERSKFIPTMEESLRSKKREGWKHAVRLSLTK